MLTQQDWAVHPLVRLSPKPQACHQLPFFCHGCLFHGANRLHKVIIQRALTS